MTIWANTIVHNEENFIYFALMSVVDYVDKIIVWDTGSADRTVETIKEVIKIKGEKIVFKEVGKVDEQEFTMMRQKMLEESKCDWILILDGDEVWWEESIKNVRQEIEKQGKNMDAIVVPFYNLAGDIYNYQSQNAGKYRLLGREGHLTIKAVNNRSGLHWSLPYGKEGLFDKNEIPIQEKDQNKLVFLNLPFLHFTHLKRSSKTLSKYKYDLGVAFPKDFKFPEVFYKSRPAMVVSPWKRRNVVYEIISLLQYPYTFLSRSIKK